MRTIPPPKLFHPSLDPKWPPSRHERPAALRVRRRAITTHPPSPWLPSPCHYVQSASSLHYATRTSSRQAAVREEQEEREGERGQEMSRHPSGSGKRYDASRAFFLIATMLYRSVGSLVSGSWPHSKGLTNPCAAHRLGETAWALGALARQGAHYA